LKATRSIIVAALAVAVAFWLWRVFFPGDEALIRRQLVELAEAASFPPNEAPLAKVANAGKVAGHFTVDVELALNHWDAGQVHLKGRDELREAAVGARSTLNSLQVAVENVVITLDPEPGHATARLSLLVRAGGESERRTLELQLALRKVDSDWLIHRAATIEYVNQ